jgi:prepilin-type N-terminal cleavage/methylation domain-containing protein
MKMDGKHAGFTLVEMLIVISIVGIMATLSIGGYMSFRKSSILDLTADSIAANVSDARDHAKWEGSKCFGIKFDSSGVSKVTAAFDSKKTWDSASSTWNYGGCGDLDPVSQPIDLGQDLMIEGDGTDCTVLFAPPSGEMGKTGCTDLVLTYKGETSTDLKMAIQIDPVSGKVTINKIDAQN